jgi:hypothetical protein
VTNGQEEGACQRIGDTRERIVRISGRSAPSGRAGRVFSEQAVPGNVCQPRETVYASIKKSLGLCKRDSKADTNQTLGTSYYSAWCRKHLAGRIKKTSNFRYADGLHYRYDILLSPVLHPRDARDISAPKSGSTRLHRLLGFHSILASQGKEQRSFHFGGSALSGQAMWGRKLGVIEIRLDMQRWRNEQNFQSSAVQDQYHVGTGVLNTITNEMSSR